MPDVKREVTTLVLPHLFIITQAVTVADFAWATKRFASNGTGVIKSGHSKNDRRPGLLIATKHKSFYPMLEEEPHAVSKSFIA